MADTLIERLDQVIDALLTGGDASAALRDAELAPLARVAAELRHLPPSTFRRQLRRQFERKADMTAIDTTVREDFTTVTPYIIVPDEGMMQFLRDVFDATETFSARGSAGGIHREVRLGTSMLMVGELAGTSVKPMEFHVYVEDVDATYARALAAGATSLGEPADRPYGERSGFVRDTYGNQWYIARALNGPAIPRGLRSVTPFLHPPDTLRFIEFLQRAFGAVEQFRDTSPSGEVRFAAMQIGSAAVELGEPGYTSMPGYFHLRVTDVDAAHDRAVAAGAQSIAAPAPQPHGGRGATVEDPMGNHWFLAQT